MSSSSHVDSNPFPTLNLLMSPSSDPPAAVRRSVTGAITAAASLGAAAGAEQLPLQKANSMPRPTASYLLLLPHRPIQISSQRLEFVLLSFRLNIFLHNSHQGLTYPSRDPVHRLIPYSIAHRSVSASLSRSAQSMKGLNNHCDASKACFCGLSSFEEA